MDSRTLTKLPRNMLYCGLVASLTSFSIGYVIGSPNIPENSIRGKDGSCGPNPYTIQAGFPNCLEFSDLIWGFAVGSFCIGACIGGFVGGDIQNRVGRIRSLMITNFVLILGSLILSLTYHQIQFIVGRIVVGLACGLGSVVTPTYLGEISTTSGRGFLGALYQLFILIGLVLSNFIGLAWASPPGWRIVFAVNAIPALLQAFVLFTLVESPRYLVSKQRLEEAHLSLQKLRGPVEEVDVSQELDDMVLLLLGIQSKQGQQQQQQQQQQRREEGNGEKDKATSLKDTGSSEKIHHSLTITESESSILHLSKPTTQESYGIFQLLRSECRGLALIGVTIHFLQQASGINGLVYYSTSFLANVFGSENSKYITIGISCCSLLVCILSVYLVDRFPRKSLMLTSFIGLSLSAILVIISTYFDLSYLIVVAVFMYFIAFNMALGPIPWLLVSEMLPTYALSPASSIATGVNWGTNFIVGLVFPSMTRVLGNGTFFVFGAFNIFGIFYVWYIVPETKGRSVEMVMAEKGVAPRVK
ncbi:hypothetical protein BX616_006137 [Lobosporangium transversale]|nr:hypothetical protein BX616_006137 [Lobosporangium transversale]